MDSLGLYLISLLTMGGIYAVLALGLNIQWGMTGLMNAGVAGFVAIGAYTTAILTTAPSGMHLGGFGWPVWAGMLAATLASGLLALPIALICIRLRSDYLAMATLGIAEILRLVVRNEEWATGGPRGVAGLPKPFTDLAAPYDQLAYLGMVLALIALVYWLAERAYRAPWGRVQRAIRENEVAAAAAGKNVEAFRLQSFVLGAMVMGLGGSLLAHNIRFIGPEAVEPLIATFLVWVMLIAGGSGNNRGAILGAFAIWSLWAVTEIATAQLPPELGGRAAYVRVFLIGLALQLILLYRPQGLIGEKPPRPLSRID
ncbi:MAG: branched-chain amino acid ABC transporter permease [Alphaproteobacteria bacterium]|nr:branched-chain amino acid ABC transporter permease [Alphaproteobacteria bacterium]TAD87798.1 MAG: branched-chain amino acid ABC transporter permease [Alphaproteobacteria bacterium]